MIFKICRNKLAQLTTHPQHSFYLVPYNAHKTQKGIISNLSKITKRTQIKMTWTDQSSFYKRNAGTSTNFHSQMIISFWLWNAWIGPEALTLFLAFGAPWLVSTYSLGQQILSKWMKLLFQGFTGRRLIARRGRGKALLQRLQELLKLADDLFRNNTTNILKYMLRSALTMMAQQLLTIAIEITSSVYQCIVLVPNIVFLQDWADHFQCDFWCSHATEAGGQNHLCFFLQILKNSVS